MGPVSDDRWRNSYAISFADVDIGEDEGELGGGVDVDVEAV